MTAMVHAMVHAMVYAMTAMVRRTSNEASEACGRHPSEAVPSWAKLDSVDPCTYSHLHYMAYIWPICITYI